MKNNSLTMTLGDVCRLFRQHGIPVEASQLADDIEAGIYPFGRLVKKSPTTQRRTFQIWRVDVLAFLKSKYPTEVIAGAE